jgi:hypothetical protein
LFDAAGAEAEIVMKMRERQSKCGAIHQCACMFAFGLLVAGSATAIEKTIDGFSGDFSIAAQAGVKSHTKTMTVSGWFRQRLGDPCSRWQIAAPATCSLSSQTDEADQAATEVPCVDWYDRLTPAEQIAAPEIDLQDPILAILFAPDPIQIDLGAGGQAAGVRQQLAMMGF